MFRSLRFRLPALFLVGIVFSGLIASLIALRLFQGSVEDRLKEELRRDAVGVTELYQEAASRENGAAPKFAAAKLEKATGARLYYIGLSVCPDVKRPCGMRPLPKTYLPNWLANRQITFEFTPPDTDQRYVAVANPLRIPSGKGTSIQFGDLVVAKPEAEQQERNFLMSVSHELRTPLTAIMGHVDALREGVADDPELRAASLDVIAAEAQRLERLVGEVLDLAKLNAHRFTVMDE